MNNFEKASVFQCTFTHIFSFVQYKNLSLFPNSFHLILKKIEIVVLLLKEKPNKLHCIKSLDFN